MKFIPFPQIVGPTYTLASVNAECQRCVNLMVEAIESGQGDNAFYLRETPGLKVFFNSDTTSLPLAPGGSVDNLTCPITCQALFKAPNGRVFFIMRNTLYEIDILGVVTWRGNLVRSNRVYKFRLAANTNVLGIMADFVSWSGGDPSTFGLGTLNFSDNQFFNCDSHVRTGFQGAKFISFLDQYFLTTCINSSAKLTTQFQISPLNMTNITGDTWDAGDVFGVESSPDNINAAIINGREYWIFGPESYEVWFNSDDPLRPFQRIRDAAYAIGCIAPDSVQSFQKSVFWLGGSKEGFGIVWMSEGYQAKRISTIAIEKLLQSAGIIDDAISWSYQNAGHACYVISLPSAKVTYSYDLTTELWHELAYRDPVTQEVMQHRAQCQVFAFNKNLLGDFEKGIIYEYDQNTFTDNTAPIVRYRRAPVVSQGQRKVFYGKIEFNMQTGVGLGDNSTTGDDPIISVRWSNDNANTWGNYHTMSLGKKGKYNKKVLKNRCGVGTQRVFEVYSDAPVPFRLISAELGIDLGVH